MACVCECDWCDKRSFAIDPEWGEWKTDWGTWGFNLPEGWIREGDYVSSMYCSEECQKKGIKFDEEMKEIAAKNRASGL